jgi:hypothetical protein
VRGLKDAIRWLRRQEGAFTIEAQGELPTKTPEISKPHTKHPNNQLMQLEISAQAADSSLA